MENNSNQDQTKYPIQSFDEYHAANPLNTIMAAVNESTSNFDYTILKDFCKIRNRNLAGHDGPDPSPRLEFIMDLLNKLGIEYELDIWSKQSPITSSLKDFFGFGVDDIEDMLVSAPKEWTTDEMAEEHYILENAFEWFNNSVDELKDMLREAERNNESKRKKRMLNTLIRIKATQFEENSRVNNFFNLYLKGSSDKMIMAHHDVANTRIDNCNDNSASVINAISCKLLMPDVNVAITDGEENGGHGAARAAEKINEGHFGPIEFVLNFELTAWGGKDFFIENHPSSPLQQRVVNLFPEVDVENTPFHDGIVLRRHGIDSVVINPCPRKEDGDLDMSILYYCHSAKDTIALANFDDMKDFCECVVVPIIRNTTPPHIDEIHEKNIELKIKREAKAKARKSWSSKYAEFDDDDFFNHNPNASAIPREHQKYVPPTRNKIPPASKGPIVIDNNTGNVIRDGDGANGSE